MGFFSRQVFPILQLARMALVFTAISNSLCTLLLWMRKEYGPDATGMLSWKQVAAVALTSTGLYGFGMALNDIIDRRRDQQLAAYRPLPSGNIGVFTAHLVTGLLLALALLAGSFYSHLSQLGWMPVVLVVWTALLILFYDLAGKYLVAIGLLSLGLVRFFHAVIPAPHVPLLWHPLLLLNHVTLLSLLSYRWEQKRPPLSLLHWVAVPGGLLLIDVLMIALVLLRRWPSRGSIVRALWIKPELVLPLIAAVAFVLLAWFLWKRSASEREAGQRIMLYGLLWLIVYDASFALAYIGWKAAVMLLAMLPLALLSVRLMRWWTGILALSRQPQFKRAV